VTGKTEILGRKEASVDKISAGGNHFLPGFQSCPSLFAVTVSQSRVWADAILLTVVNGVFVISAIS